MKHKLFSRFISVLLAVVMLASLMSMPSLATDDVQEPDPAVTSGEQMTDSTESDVADPTDDPAAQSDEITDEGTSSGENTDEPVVSGEENDETVVSGEENSEKAVSGEEEATVPSEEETVSNDEVAPSEEEDASSQEETAPAAVQLTAEAKDENDNVVANVTAEADEGVIPEGATLVADLLTGNDAETAAAELDEAGVEYDGYMALDIHLEDADGNEVEPNGEVRVVMVVPDALPEDADPTTVAVQHHEEQDNGEVKVEEVASAADTAATPATLSLTEDSIERPATGVATENTDVTAAFDVENFSTFTITWGVWFNRHTITVTTKADGQDINVSGTSNQYTINKNVTYASTILSATVPWSTTYNNATYSLQGLYYNDKQIVSMSTEKINYVDGNYETPSDGMKFEARYVKLETIQGVQPAGVAVNLYNYQSGLKECGLTFSDGNPSRRYGDYDLWTGNINLDPFWKNGNYVYQGIASKKLNGEGYPNNALYHNTSLKPLFTGGDGVEAYENVVNLFQEDDGYYYYNSDNNFAELAKTSDGKNQFILYNVSNQNYFGGAEAPKFLPFNTFADGSVKQGQYGSGSPDYHFGMSINFDFVQPASGKVNDKDMVFEFTGDDDVWLYIDDVLVLDLGGIHNAATGNVDFATGKITYVGVNSCYNTNLYSCFMNAGYTSNQLDKIFEKTNDGNYRFKDYSSHTFDYFYLERGQGGSNCQIRFNIPAVPTTDLAVSKQITKIGTNDLINDQTEFTFVLKKDGQALEGANYQVYKLDAYTQNPSNPGPIIRESSTTAGGSFILCADEVAVFKDIIEVSDQSSYTVTEVLTGKTYADEIDSVHVNGEESTTHQASLNANVRYASFNNWVKDKGEYSLKLTKQWKDKQGTSVPAAEIPFTEVQVDVEQYYKSGASGSEQVINNDTLKLTAQNNWTDQYGEMVYNYTAFRGVTERVYVNDELVVTYTYTNGEWEPFWEEGMQGLYPEWTIGEFAFDREYIANGSYFNVITTNQDTKITIPASNCLVAKNNTDAVIWMPYLDALSSSAREALKEAVKESTFENGWGSTDGEFYLIDDEDLPDDLASAAATLKNITYSEDGKQVTIEFTSKNAWTKVAAGEVKIDSNVTECSLSNVLDKSIAKVSIPVEKVWADDSGNEHETITVDLMNGNTKVADAVLSKYNKWSGKFTDLAKYDSNGNLIYYSTYKVMDDVEGYESSSEYKDGKFIITNTPSDGYLIINKLLAGESQKLGNGKDVFSFMIEAESGEEEGKVWYAHIDGNGMATLNGEGVEVIIGESEEKVTMVLPAGKYKITELSNINYTCTNIATVDEATVDEKVVMNPDTNARTITVKVDGGAVTTVTYTNSSKGTSFTDGSGVINKFSDTNGKITFDRILIAGDPEEKNNWEQQEPTGEQQN